MGGKKYIKLFLKIVHFGTNTKNSVSFYLFIGLTDRSTILSPDLEAASLVYSFQLAWRASIATKNCLCGTTLRARKTRCKTDVKKYSAHGRCGFHRLTRCALVRGEIPKIQGTIHHSLVVSIEPRLTSSYKTTIDCGA